MKSFARTCALLSLVSTCHASHLWTDEFNQQPDTFNIRDFIGRQVFSPGSNLVAPVGFLTNAVNPTQPTNYHEQIQGNKLLIAGDSMIGTFNADPLLNTFGLSLVALNRNFNGVTSAGFADGVVTQCGQLIFILDTMTNAAPNTYGYTGLTVGGDTMAASTTVGFSIRFVEDNKFGFGNFIQFYDGQTLLQNLIPNPAEAGSMNVELNFSDTDNNPWDGVGATTITVYVNGTKVGNTFTKGGGGFSNNFITFEGSDDQVTHNLGIHTIDTITINAAVALTPVQLWRQTNFGNPNSTGIGADEFDADSDGTANLIEYATGTNPNQVTAPPLSLSAGSLLTVSYRRSLLATDVTLLLETSAELTPGSWVPAGGVDIETSNDGAIATFDRTIPSSGQPRNFVRSRVSIP